MSPPSRAFPLLASLLALLVVFWFVAVLATPYLGTHRPLGPTAIRAAGIMYMAGSFVCHQRPERSFHLEGVQLPVCARCTGLYAGAALGVFWVAPLGARTPRHGRRIRTGRLSWRLILVAAALPTAIALVLEWSRLAAPANAIRAAAALPFGAAMVWLAADVLGSRHEVN